MMNTTFHIAFSTRNLDKAIEFYGGFLGCKIGRSGPSWVDFDFYGNQLTIQYISDKKNQYPNFYHPKTGFPLNHWGVILEHKDWSTLKEKFESENVNFVVDPQIVMEGEIGEQHTMMLRDPDGNIIEFKSFEDLGSIFRYE